MRARRAGSIAALACSAAFTLFATLGHTDERPGLTFAVLRRDGVILPFATFDGDRWSNRWPAEMAAEVPIGLGDVPKGWWPGSQVRTEWTAYLTSGATQAIKAQAPTLVNIHCTRRVALRTDFMSLEPAPPPDYQPYPKSGLAVTGTSTAAVERVELVPPTSPEALEVAGRVASSVTEAENGAVRAWSAHWSHPASAKVRATTPVTLEVLARTAGPNPNSKTYYFEAVKKYPGFFQLPARTPLVTSSADLPQMCEYITFAGGWVFGAQPGEVVKPLVGAELTNCNRDGIAYTLPLGAVRSGGRLFWIVQVSGWNFERYDVVEVRTKDVKTALTVGGGACQ
jgi:hypothetical protein